MHYQLTDKFIVSADADKTWAFFSDAGNLPAITPPWLSFTITTPQPIRIALDARIDYTIRWAGLPVRWRTLIIDWTPPARFVDLQLKGPYALWHHTHTFEPCPEGTLCSDRVIYRLPGLVINRIAHGLIVKRQLQEIFRFRREAMKQHLGWVRGVQEDIEITPLG